MVLTTEQLAEVYETEVKNIQMNFSNNKDKFIEGKHYHILQGADLKEFKSLPNNFGVADKFAPILYLWTKRGASRHSKMLGTDRAWEQFDVLEENYFNPPQKQLTATELILEMAKNNVETERKIQLIAQKQDEQSTEIQEIRNVVALSSMDWRKESEQLMKQIALKLGGFSFMQELRSESYRLLDERMAVSVQTRLTNKRRRMAEEGICKSTRDKLNPLDVIGEDKKLVEGYIAIIKEMAIKYGIGKSA
jgi:hypothetical protein